MQRLRGSILAAATLAVLFGGAAAAHGCELCSVYTALEAKTSEPGFFVGFFDQWTEFGSLREGRHAVANPAHERLRSSIAQVLVGYQIDRRFGIQANVPWIDRSFRRAHDGETTRGHEGGLGDVAVMARFRAVERFAGRATFAWDVLAGVKLPTGDSARLAEEVDEHPTAGELGSGIHGHDLALGSGSTDGLVGTSLLASRGRWFAAATAQYAIRRAGDFGYRYADDLVWSLAPGAFVWLSHGRSASLGLALSGERKGEDEQHGVATDDTAVTTLYAGPTATVSWRTSFYGELAADLPLRQRTSGLQAVPDWRIRLALTARF